MTDDVESTAKTPWYKSPGWITVIITALALVATVVFGIRGWQREGDQLEPTPSPASALPDPELAGPGTAPPEYRDALSELEELYFAARYEDVVVIAHGEFLGTDAIDDLPLELQVWLLHLAGNADYEIGQLDAAAELLDRAGALAGDLPDERVRGSVLLSSSVVEAERGDFDSAEGLFAEAEELLAEADARTRVALSVSRCALDLRDPSRLPDARESCLVAIESAATEGFETLQAAALINMGVIALQDDDLVEALARLADAIAISENTGTTRLLIAALNGRGLAQRSLELYADARNDLQRAADLSRTVPNDLDEGRSLNNAALLFADCYDVEHARELLELAKHLVSGTGAQRVTQAVSENLDALADAAPPDESPAAGCGNLVRLQLPQR